MSERVEFRAKPKGLGWVLQERRFGFWVTLYRSYDFGEVAVPMEYDTIEEARRAADKMRQKAAARADEKRRRAEHEQEETVSL